MVKENVTIVDGQMYKPGDEIWDLGSFVATSARGRRRNYEGLSKDVEKLPHYVDTGSSAFCFDTGDFYKYLRLTDTWYKIGNNQASCGGCGGSGGSGVSNYNDLNGKPKINGVTLEGDMTLEDLGIAKIVNETADTPVGEIISYMGNTVPKNYLVCDGTEYNISEYQELANHFKKEFGQVNYFGGDGITTFAVPDLRGEFLRGTGNNSHVNTTTGIYEGGGSAVGVHQNATVTVPIGVSYESGHDYVSVAHNAADWSGYANADTVSTATSDNAYFQNTNKNTSKRSRHMTSRPTNTSVLYCIKYKIKNETNLSNVLSFNEDGDLVVTIDGVNKVFSPKM